MSSLLGVSGGQPVAPDAPDGEAQPVRGAFGAGAPIPRQPPAPARKWSFRLARVFGIDLYVHVTFFALLAWIAVTPILAGRGALEGLRGVAMVVAVFAIVVMHELGHALTARRFGIRTRDILLLPIGGVASLDRLPEKPSQELLVAIAGPAVNVVLAAVFAALVVATGGQLTAPSVHLGSGPLLTQLMWINVSLAAFNLLPAFPMDGGRVLRALLATRLPYVRATELAARIGQAMALLLGLTGLLVNPMWLVVAFFVWFGAQQESALVEAKAVLHGLVARDAMVRTFERLDADVRVTAAAHAMIGGFQRDFPVLRNGQLVGLLRGPDVLRALALGETDLRAFELARPNVVVCSPEAKLDEVLGKLSQVGGAVLVVEGGELVGMLEAENVLELVALIHAQDASAARERSRQAAVDARIAGSSRGE